MTDQPGFWGRLWYNTVHWGTFTLFTFGFSLRTAGWGHVPTKGPVLVLSNHQSMFDPAIVGISIRRYLVYLARQNLFEQPILGPFIRSVGAIPIDRELGKDGLKAVLGALDRGRAVLVFPEGERTHTGQVQPLKRGVSLLIERVKCPIVPVGVAGAFAAWSRFMKWPKPAPLFLPPAPSTLAVSVGHPIDPARYAAMSRDEILADLHATLVAQQAAAERLRRK
jgi:1-acyl-sn-glycerol-3-phosphate acyltransferase